MFLEFYSNKNEAEPVFTGSTTSLIFVLILLSQVLLIITWTDLRRTKIKGISKVTQRWCLDLLWQLPGPTRGQVLLRQRTVLVRKNHKCLRQECSSDDSTTSADETKTHWNSCRTLSDIEVITWCLIDLKLIQFVKLVLNISMQRNIHTWKWFERFLTRKQMNWCNPSELQS